GFVEETEGDGFLGFGGKVVVDLCAGEGVGCAVASTTVVAAGGDAVRGLRLVERAWVDWVAGLQLVERAYVIEDVEAASLGGEDEVVVGEFDVGDGGVGQVELEGLPGCAAIE